MGGGGSARPWSWWGHGGGHRDGDDAQDHSGRNLRPAGGPRRTGAGPASAGNPFFSAEPPDLLYLGWTAAWIVVFLSLAVWSFQRREI